MTDPIDAAPQGAAAESGRLPVERPHLGTTRTVPGPRGTRRKRGLGGEAAIAEELAEHVLRPQPRRVRATPARRAAPVDARSARRFGDVRAGAARAVVGDDQYAAWRSYWDGGDDGARNALVEAYQKLVGEIVGRFGAKLPRTVDRGDLATAANVGLIASITSFDPRRGVRFEAYADRRIRGALLDELRSQDWLPRPWRQRIELHKRLGERLRAELEREPRDHELAAALDLPLEEYQLLFGTGLPGTPGGANALADGDGAAAGMDVVPDTRSDAPDDHLTRDELMSLVAQRLSDQEYRIVYLRYWEDLPMREIGRLTGLSESRVCKIHTRLIGRLRERLASHG